MLDIPEKLELAEKENLTVFEVEKLQRLAAWLYEKNKQLSLENLALNVKQFKAFNGEECWIWQGDGSDHLESLCCPVVIHPIDLREIINANAAYRNALEQLCDKLPNNEALAYYFARDELLAARKVIESHGGDK